MRIIKTNVTFVLLRVFYKFIHFQFHLKQFEDQHDGTEEGLVTRIYQLYSTLLCFELNKQILRMNARQIRREMAIGVLSQLPLVVDSVPRGLQSRIKCYRHQ